MNSRRMAWLVGGLTAVSAGAAAVLKGLPWAASFLLGALASMVVLWGLHRMVDSIDPTRPPDRSWAGRAWTVAMRYALLGLGGYAILNFSTLPISGALVGLFVPAAAVVLEILIELSYGAS